MAKKYWLLKSEPETFSWQDLLQRPQQREPWNGVRNYQARNLLRDSIQLDDLAFFYHSSTKEPAIVGIVRIVRPGYPDPSAWDPHSPYFDAKSPIDGPARWFMVDVEAVAALPEPLTLSRLRQSPELSGMALLQRGQRLSVQAVSEPHWLACLDLAQVSLEVQTDANAQSQSPKAMDA